MMHHHLQTRRTSGSNISYSSGHERAVSLQEDLSDLLTSRTLWKTIYRPDVEGRG